MMRMFFGSGGVVSGWLFSPVPMPKIRSALV
jgi:hypothetical protein